MNGIIILFSLLFAAVLTLFLLPFAPIVNYTIAFITSSALFLFIAFKIFKEDISEKTIFFLAAASIIVHFVLINTTPIGSDDIYRYMWDGKVQAYGVNPYQFAPNDKALNHLSTEQIPSLVNHADLKTIYFPLSEWLFFLSYSISGESVWGYKLLLLVFELLSFYGLFLLTKKLQIPLKFILLYALCPFLIFEYALDAHADGFGLALLIFFLYFYFTERKILSLIFLGLSLSIKPVGLILLLVLFFHEKEWKMKLQILFIPLFTVTVQFIPYIFSANPFEALLKFTEHWTFNGFVFNTLDLYFHDNRKSRLVCSILLSIVILLISLSKKNLIDKIYFAILFLLLFSPIVHPWYVGWLAVVIPIARKWSGIVFVNTVCFTSFTYISYQLHGVWKEEPIQWLAIYLPVVVMLAMELKRNSKYFGFPPSSHFAGLRRTGRNLDL